MAGATVKAGYGWHALALTSLLLFGVPAAAHAADAELINHVHSNPPDCGRFEQSRWLADFEMHLNSSGEFHRQPDGLIWRTTQPIVSEVALTEHNPELPLGYQTILPLFNGLLAGDLNSLDDYFTIQLSDTPAAWHADLSPRNEQVSAQLTGLIISGAAQLEHITVTFRDGDRMDIKLLAMPCPAQSETQ